MTIKSPTAQFLSLTLAFISCLSSLAQDYDWPHYANDQGSSKYADLDQINKETVQDLQVSWMWKSIDNAQISVRPNLFRLVSNPRLYIKTAFFTSAHRWAI